MGPVPQKLAILGLGNPLHAEGRDHRQIVPLKSYQELLDLPPGALKGKIAVVTGR